MHWTLESKPPSQPLNPLTAFSFDVSFINTHIVQTLKMVNIQHRYEMDYKWTKRSQRKIHAVSTHEVGVLLIQMVGCFEQLFWFRLQLGEYACRVLHQLVPLDHHHCQAQIVYVLIHPYFCTQQSIPDQNGLVDLELLQHQHHYPPHTCQLQIDLIVLKQLVELLIHLLQRFAEHLDPFIHVLRAGKMLRPQHRHDDAKHIIGISLAYSPLILRVLVGEDIIQQCCYLVHALGVSYLGVQLTKQEQDTRHSVIVIAAPLVLRQVQRLFELHCFKLQFMLFLEELYLGSGSQDIPLYLYPQLMVLKIGIPCGVGIPIKGMINTGPYYHLMTSVRFNLFFGL